MAKSTARESTQKTSSKNLEKVRKELLNTGYAKLPGRLNGVDEVLDRVKETSTFMSVIGTRNKRQLGDGAWSKDIEDAISRILQNFGLLVGSSSANKKYITTCKVRQPKSALHKHSKKTNENVIVVLRCRH